MCSTTMASCAMPSGWLSVSYLHVWAGETFDTIAALKTAIAPEIDPRKEKKAVGLCLSGFAN